MKGPPSHQNRAKREERHQTRFGGGRRLPKALTSPSTAQSGPFFFCVGTTNEFSLTADSSDDVTWEITPTPGTNGPGFAGSSNTGRTVLIRAGSECGDYSVHAFVTGLSNCTCSPVSFKVVKPTSLTASGGVESYPAGGSNCYVTYPPVYGPPSPVTVTASYCPEPMLTNYLPACWRWDTAGPGISGSNLLSRTVDPTQPGTNDLTVVCGTSSNSCRVIALKVAIQEPDQYVGLGQANPITFHLTTDSSLPVEWSLSTTDGGVGFEGGTNTGPTVSVLPGTNAGIFTVSAYSLVKTGCCASVKVTVVAVGFLVKDLFGTLEESQQNDPGAFVHWNLDNDDESDNSLGGTKHPGGDYLETGASEITGENDLAELLIWTSPTDLREGSVVLTIENGKASVWASSLKGSSNLIHAGAGDKTWDLSDSEQRSKFSTDQSSLRVEGLLDGTCNLKVAFKSPSGTEVDYDTASYTFIAANCGRQPRTSGLNERAAVQAGFSNLVHCEWSITGETNDAYNCIAWSIGDTTHIYNPEEIDVQFGNVDGIFDVSDVDDFYYYKMGWTPIATNAADAKAIYYPWPTPWNYVANPNNPPSNGFHAAARKSCSCGAGKWIMFESKGGGGIQLEHVWNQLDGSFYGSAGRFYK